METKYKKSKKLGICLCGKEIVANKSQCAECRLIYKSRSKLRYEKRILSGVCVTCGKNKLIKNETRCIDCKQKQNEIIKIKRKDLPKDICKTCCKAKIEFGSRCQTCREYTRKYRQKNNKKRNLQIRQEVFQAYGGFKCVCCGETENAFLTIDHINGGGNQHRKQVNGSLYFWYKKNNFPIGYQVLCMNCNFAKGRLGYCPHTKNIDKK